MPPGRIADETAHPAVSARSVVAQLPHMPGVYRFRDASKRVLYIGRAINLRRRVGSYWTQPHGRLAEMVRRIVSVEAERSARASTKPRGSSAICWSKRCQRGTRPRAAKKYRSI